MAMKSRSVMQEAEGEEIEIIRLPGGYFASAAVASAESPRFINT